MRFHLAGLLTVLIPVQALAAQVRGEIVVVEDAQGDAHTGFTALPLNVCAFGARGLYSVLGDDFDAVMVFTSHPMQGLQYLAATTPVGYSVRQPAAGVAYGSVFTPRPASDYGSAATLQHCVFMGPLRTLPPSPDSEYNLGLKAVEVLGHEFGHHWLVYAAFDKNDGLGPQALLRANLRDMPDADPISSSTLHYSTLADSHSVMLGSFITDLGGGNFLLQGGARQYGPLDQYLMGLRAPEETPPMLVIDDGTHLGLYEQPLRPGESSMHSGTAVMVGVDDVVRAHGVRTPAYPNAQHCWRTAFILVTQQGHTATDEEVALVETYRARWEQWFPWATDGRGRVNALLGATQCESSASDAGAAIADASAAGMDAASEDAAIPVVTDSGHGGTPGDAGVLDGGNPDRIIRDVGCGCEETRAPPSPAGLVLLALAAFIIRRARV